MSIMDHSVRVATKLTWGHNPKVKFPSEWVWVSHEPATIRLVIESSHVIPIPRPAGNEDGNLSVYAPVAEWARSRAEWTMSRSLLRDALLGIRGVGAVRMIVYPQRSTTLNIALLTANCGWFEATTSAKTMSGFLAVTYGHISTVRESLMVQEAANRLDPSTFLETE